MSKLLFNRLFGNAFNLIPQLGPVSLNRLLKHFGDFETAWFASTSDYAQAGISDKIIAEISTSKKQLNPEKAFAELARRQIEVITILEPEYPTLLKEISAAPPLLYIRGNKSALQQAGIGVVGTRKISAYGRLVCEELVAGLVQSNLSIISGLAFGIDAQALETCLTEAGTPLAVLASDLDNSSISPRTNFQLAQKIIEAGCLISENPLGSTVGKQNFPIRNRLISGLSLGTLVIEADEDSGSLITANFALEQNREVFAVPGSIFSATSRGTNTLIRKGAKLVSHVSDILDELNIPNANAEPITLVATEDEQLVLDVLSKTPVHINDLIKTVKLAPGAVNANLTRLEMKSRIKNLGGGQYVKIR